MASTTVTQPTARRALMRRVRAKRRRARRTLGAVEPMHESAERALALKRYICLLIDRRVVVHMQLALRDDLQPALMRSLLGAFHRVGLVAHAVDSKTLLLAADLRRGLAFTDLAAAHGVLSERLGAHNDAMFGQRASRTRMQDKGALRGLKSLIGVIAYVDFAKPRAFAKAGFDVARICSNPRYQ
jgi:hypothetical protein